MATPDQVKPNRRGTRSRQVVLDAAERLMSEHGFDGVPISAIVDESGIPLSSVYHYFGSKNGLLLAVMERGAGRFFESLPTLTERQGSPDEHMAVVVTGITAVLEEHPEFLRLLIALSAQPPDDGVEEVRVVVNRVRNTALDGLRAQLALAYGIDPEGTTAHELARLMLAAFDGAFIAARADSNARTEDTLRRLPAALRGALEDSGSASP